MERKKKKNSRLLPQIYGDRKIDLDAHDECPTRTDLPHLGDSKEKGKS